METRNYAGFMSELGNILPKERIYTDELRTLGWGTDASFYRLTPKVVVRSDGEQELSKIVKLASKYKMRRPKQHSTPARNSRFEGK